MARKKKTSHFKVGNVYAIKLQDDTFAFGIQCVSNEVAFFDYRSKESSVPDDILLKPRAFRLLVAVDELEAETWPIVGEIKPGEEFFKHGSYLHKPIGVPNCFVYCNGDSSQATEDQVKTLEVLSVWFVSHVQERLESFFKGEKSKYDLAIRKQLGI